MIFQTKAPRGLLYWVMEPHLAQMINQEERNILFSRINQVSRERPKKEPNICTISVIKIFDKNFQKMPNLVTLVFGHVGLIKFWRNSLAGLI